MIVYIAGKITGLLDYKTKFNEAEKMLKEQGHIVINPAFLPVGLGSLDVYLSICFPMIDASEVLYRLPDINDSAGGVKELIYAKSKGKIIW